MEREDLVKRSWKAYQEIEYKDHGMDESITCLLVSIDFDAELMKLQPLTDDYFDNDFFANIKYCNVPRRKMAAVNP